MQLPSKFQIDDRVWIDRFPQSSNPVQILGIAFRKISESITGLREFRVTYDVQLNNHDVGGVRLGIPEIDLSPVAFEPSPAT